MTALRKFIFILCVALSSQVAHANPSSNTPTGKSWIAQSFPFEKNLSVIEQAHRWAMCSATLEVFSDVIKQMGKPETATNFKNYSNGAATAIIGLFIVDAADKLKDKKDEEVVKSFDKIVKYAQFASTDYPQSAKAKIGMMRENTPNTDQFMADLLESAQSCMKKEVLEIQELYINAVRQMFLGVGG